MKIETFRSRAEKTVIDLVQRSVNIRAPNAVVQLDQDPHFKNRPRSTRRDPPCSLRTDLAHLVPHIQLSTTVDLGSTITVRTVDKRVPSLRHHCHIIRTEPYRKVQCIGTRKR